MPKRDLFEELKSGLEDARIHEQEKLTLKTRIISGGRGVFKHISNSLYYI